MSKYEAFRKRMKLEVVVAVTLAVLAILCFSIQIYTYSSKTTTLETALFNLLQFVLTIGFSWYGSRAISRSEFEESLKKFAISAYRRVCDIDIMLERLQNGISDMLSLGNQPEPINLQMISAVVNDTKLIISSSIADWADVIGEELLTLQRIHSLQENKLGLSDRKIDDHGAPTANIPGLQKEIEFLKSKLPMALQMASEEALTSRYGPRWLATQHYEKKGLLLQVVAGGVYSDGLVFELNDYPRPLFINEIEGKFVVMSGDDGKIYGQVLNFLPFSYEKSMACLKSCYGKSKIEVECTRVLRKYEIEGKPFVHIEIRVLCTPKAEPDSWLVK